MNSCIDIVIVNWNSGRYLAECVNSIRSFSENLVESVIVVDNGSTDNSLEFECKGDALDIVRAGSNLGFARACNLGARKGSAKYILFLNPDARLAARVLSHVTAFLESKRGSTCGICGVKLFDEKGKVHRHCCNFPSWRTYVGKALGLEGKIPWLFPHHFMVDFDHETSRAVDQVTGAFFFVRRKSYDGLAGFDERFFVYFEELDFSLRAMEAGWSTWYLADVATFHKSGGCSDQVKATTLFYLIRSRILYALKHFSALGAGAVVIASIAIEPLARFLRAILRGSSEELRNTAGGYSMLWRALGDIFRQHRCLVRK